MLTEEIERVYTELSSREIDQGFRIVGDTIYGMLIVSATKEMDSAHGSLLLSLFTAGIGISTSKKKQIGVGVLPHSLQRVVDNFAEKLFLFSPQEAQGNRYYLSLLLTLLTSGTMISTALMMEYGGGLFPLELMLRLMVRSQFLSSISIGIAKACGIVEEELDLASELIVCMTLATVFLTIAAKKNREEAIALITPIIDLLEDSVEALELYLERFGTDMGAAGPLLKQVIIAIRTGNGEILEHSMEEALEILKLDSTELSFKEECKDINHFIKSFWRHIGASDLKQLRATTGIVEVQG